MLRYLFIFLIACSVSSLSAQPKARRQAQQATQTTAKDQVTLRARLSFPTENKMSEDVVWRRDIYRELDLNDAANAGLYHPVEPIGKQMNLFTYLFKLMMTGQIPVYEYRLDGNESFEDSARVKPKAFLDNYHIYYERKDGRVRIDNSDIPSREVTAYYLKESTYYDQTTATFHTQVLALCPIMKRQDDFGDGTTTYPLFWVKYEDLVPFLSKQTLMTSHLNNAATMTLADFFTMNKYRGKIYKTNNMLGQTLAQYCKTDSALTREQKHIESEIAAFEKNIWGDKVRKDSLDSIAKTPPVKKAKKTPRTTRRATATVTTRRTKTPSAPSTSASPRVSVRRERH